MHASEINTVLIWKMGAVMKLNDDISRAFPNNVHSIVAAERAFTIN